MTISATITVETLCVRLGAVTPADIELWTRRAWLRPQGVPGHYLFQPIDEARARLILELRQDLHIDDEALPLVLSLMDQVYAARRHMRRLRAAVEGHPDPALKDELSRLLGEDPG